jgi:hypothetical protein
MAPRGAGFAWLRRAALCLSAAALSACAQPAAAPAGCDPGDNGHRWLLRFAQPVSGDAPAVLQQLQVHSQGCVRHAASVSPTLHAYVFAPGMTAAQLRQRLLAWPLVQDAQPDQRLRAH